MQLVICPGIHDPQLTQAFLKAVLLDAQGFELPPIVFPSQTAPAYSALHLHQFLSDRLPPATPIILLAFSAGVVGAMGTAHLWQQQGNQVRALLAIDGWGVPLWGNFPIHRISHDHFTYWSSALLGSGSESFYADPPIAHLDLWGAPDTAIGWQLSVNGKKSAQRLTAAEFIAALLRRHQGAAKSGTGAGRATGKDSSVEGTR